MSRKGGIIYVRCSLFGNKQFGRQKYVGQTTRTLEERFSEHAESDSLLGRAIQRDGAENFFREVLVECETQEELDKQERLYIKKLDCKHPRGYNSTGGGRFNGSKNDARKQLDPRKEFFLKMTGAKITYYRTMRDMSQKELAMADGLHIDITMLVTFSDMEKSMWWKPLSKD